MKLDQHESLHHYIKLHSEKKEIKVFVLWTWIFRDEQTIFGSRVKVHTISMEEFKAKLLDSSERNGWEFFEKNQYQYYEHEVTERLNGWSEFHYKCKKFWPSFFAPRIWEKQKKMFQICRMLRTFVRMEFSSVDDQTDKLFTSKMSKSVSYSCSLALVGAPHFCTREYFSRWPRTKFHVCCNTWRVLKKCWRLSFSFSLLQNRSIVPFFSFFIIFVWNVLQPIFSHSFHFFSGFNGHRCWSSTSTSLFPK